MNRQVTLGGNVTPEVQDQQREEASKVIDAKNELTKSFFNDRLSRYNNIQSHNTDQGGTGVQNPKDLLKDYNGPVPYRREDVQDEQNDEPTQDEIDAENKALNSNNNQQPLVINNDDPVITRNGVSKKLSEWEAEIHQTVEQATALLNTNKKVVEQVQVDEAELDEITEAVQGGNKEQTKNALRKLLGKSAEQASQVSAQERIRNEAIRLLNGVLDENKDIASIPFLYARAQQIEKQLGGKTFVQGDLPRDAEARFREAWKLTREEYTKVTGNQRTQAEIDETNRRKNNAPHPTSSTTRSGGRTVGNQRTVTERDAGRDAVANMRKYRESLKNGR